MNWESLLWIGDWVESGRRDLWDGDWKLDFPIKRTCNALNHFTMQSHYSLPFYTITGLTYLLVLLQWTKNGQSLVKKIWIFAPKLRNFFCPIFSELSEFSKEFRAKLFWEMYNFGKIWIFAPKTFDKLILRFFLNSKSIIFSELSEFSKKFRATIFSEFFWEMQLASLAKFNFWPSISSLTNKIVIQVLIETNDLRPQKFPFEKNAP